MKIRSKMMIMFGFLLVFLILTGAISIISLLKTNSAWNDSHNFGMAILEKSDGIAFNFMSARNDAKNFLFHYNKIGIEQAKEKYVILESNRHLAKVKKLLEEMKHLESQVGDLNDVTKIEDALTNLACYRSKFNSMIARIEKKGHKDIGLIGDMREAIHDLEAKLKHVKLTNLQVNILICRKSEKDFLLRGEEQYVEKFKDATLNCKTAISGMDLTEVKKQELYIALKLYHDNFLKVVEETMKINANIVQLHALAEILDASAINFRNEGRRMSNESVNLAVGLEKPILITMISILVFALLFGVLSSTIFSKKISNSMISLSTATSKINEGDLDISVNISSDDEIGQLGQDFNDMAGTLKDVVSQVNLISKGDYSKEVEPRSQKDELGIALKVMTKSLRDITSENERQSWLKTGQAQINEQVRGDLDTVTITQKLLSFLSEYMEVQLGAIYMNQDNEELKLLGSYAYKKRKNLSDKFKIGEGLVGQAALEKKTISIANIPDDYIKITSGLGESVPRNIMVVPLIVDEDVVGVIELGSLDEFTDIQIQFMEQVSEGAAIALNSAIARVKMRELLEKTQQQAEELQTQQEELRVSNEELEEQTKALKESEADLQTQQEELRVTNEELEEQTKSLEEQKNSISGKNMELTTARTELEEKARDLQIASKYKSEFLANMSHELRTPLNSILILSQLLNENKTANMTVKQLEFAKTIHSSGEDLLNLINEILDLSKVEAGKVELQVEELYFKRIISETERTFKELALDKNLTFKITLDEELPISINTDKLRLQQILRNLLSNAFKFTQKGSVELKIFRPGKKVKLTRTSLVHENTIAFEVLDSGIGIPANKQKIIFEAFQQADGATNRRFGGTGLGLSISRELAKLLGGEIAMSSQDGKGSTFTVYIPEGVDETSEEVVQELEKVEKLELTKEKLKVETEKKKLFKEFVKDDRGVIKNGDKSLLIIEDDPNFIKIIFDLARDKGFKCLAAGNGESGLAMALEYIPSAIILDVELPGMDGFEVMESLKAEKLIRHIPVHFMSASDQQIEGMKMGAIGYLTKPVSAEAVEDAFTKISDIMSNSIKRVLLVEDNDIQSKSIMALIEGEDIETVAVKRGDQAFDILKRDSFDAIILDLGLDDMSGFELLEKIKEDGTISDVPVIIYTGKDLSQKEEEELRKYAESIIIKGVNSPERLLDETTLFLHRVESDMPAEKKEKVKMISDSDKLLEGKTILVVDDDMRNVFALSSVLEMNEMKVVVGRNGVEGLEQLDGNSDISLVLMDIMMPEMDGYEAIRRIRKNKTHKHLPIIALTAKAMKGDRQKCIDVGANDYMSKPVDTDKLLSLLRVWLQV